MPIPSLPHRRSSDAHGVALNELDSIDAPGRAARLRIAGLQAVVFVGLIKLGLIAGGVLAAGVGALIY